MTGLRKLLVSRRGMTALITALADILVTLGFKWAGHPELIGSMVTLLTVLGGALIAGYSLEDTFGKKPKEQSGASVAAGLGLEEPKEEPESGATRI